MRHIKLNEKLLNASGFEKELLQSLPEDCRYIKRIDGQDEDALVAGEEGELRTATGMIGTMDIDSDFEVIMPNAFDFTRYQKNPIILFNHDLDSPLGKMTELNQTDSGIIGKAYFGKSTFAQDMWMLIKEGILKTFSVGYITNKTSKRGDSDFNGLVTQLKSVRPDSFTDDKVKTIKRIITKAILFEVSITTIPAQENALVYAVKGISDETLAKFSKKNVNSSTLEHDEPIKIETVETVETVEAVETQTKAIESNISIVEPIIVQEVEMPNVISFKEEQPNIIEQPHVIGKGYDLNKIVLKMIKGKMS
jgi:HK97 family phage prohead protease